MKVIKTKLPDCMIIEPKIYGDERGFFLETFQDNRYSEAGISLPFVQDNHSRSVKGVLRGLHFQKTKPQGKLVRVVRGEVFDVAVDLRKGSQHLAIGRVLFYQKIIKSSFGFRQVCSWLFGTFSVDFEYKCTDYYDQAMKLVFCRIVESEYSLANYESNFVD